jgi:hypothetical protein
MNHRKWIEEALGWAKTVGGMGRTDHGGERVRSRFFLTIAANDLARPPWLLGDVYRPTENLLMLQRRR